LNEVDFEEFIGKLGIKISSEKEFQELGPIGEMVTQMN
jgi:hypothetical protein